MVRIVLGVLLGGGYEFKRRGAGIGVGEYRIDVVGLKLVVVEFSCVIFGKVGKILGIVCLRI